MVTAQLTKTLKNINGSSIAKPKRKSTSKGLLRPSVAAITATGLEKNYQHRKFHTKGGHGFAAEDANVFNDRIRGKKVEVTGGSNAAYGPDRITNGVKIQTKYFATPSKTVGSAFERGSGYRYSGQQLEVPSHQYKDCVKLFAKRIEAGEVPGFSDPKDAAKIVRKGSISYGQACKISKAGTLESLRFDVKTQSAACVCVFGISAVLSAAEGIRAGNRGKQVVKEALARGAETGGVAMATGVISSQVLRTNAARVGAVAMRSGLKSVAKTSSGKVAIQRFASASMGKAVHGAASVNCAARLLRTNAITGAVTTVAMSVPDFYRAAFQKSISWQQFGQNFCVNAAGVAGGVGGSIAAGAMIGTVIPGLGTAIGMTIGGIVGGIIVGSGASKLADRLIESDTKAMFCVIQKQAWATAKKWSLNPDQCEQFAERVGPKIDSSLIRRLFMEKAVRKRNNMAKKSLGMEDICVRLVGGNSLPRLAA